LGHSSERSGILAGFGRTLKPKQQKPHQQSNACNYEDEEIHDCLILRNAD
jgi:hypothetical protein